jgi:hypothetical protein
MQTEIGARQKENDMQKGRVAALKKPKAHRWRQGRVETRLARREDGRRKSEVWRDEMAGNNCE